MLKALLKSKLNLTVSKLALFTLLATWTLGQITNFTLHGLSRPLAIFYLILPFSCLLLLRPPLLKKNPFLVFIIFTILSFPVYTFFQKETQEMSIFLPAFLQLVKLTLTLLLLNLIPPINRPTLFTLFFALFACSWLQYFLFPNLTSLQALSWDPHLNRLTGPLLDPTFTGFIFASFSAYFFYQYYQQKTKISLLLFFLSYISLSFTYSRSSLLSFILLGLLLAKHFHKKIIFLVFFTLAITSVFLLPHNFGEGTYLARTSSIKAKIINYQEAFHFIKENPLGVGYNYLAYKRSKNGIDLLSHSAFGFDSSLLTVFSTTGLPGLILFLWGLKTWSSKLKKEKVAYFALLTLIFHSLFANSLLYPWTILFIAFLASFPAL